MPHPALFFLLAILGLGTTVYAPGLSGSFVFDDYVNIVENTALRPDAVSIRTLMEAAASSDSGPLKRPLASLSFLANFHFFGTDPLSFKIGNLAIHLLNGCLVFWLLCGVLSRLLPQEANTLAIAGLTAIIWTVHPFNLTGVLYVVQRMTSLAATFTLLAMIFYVRARVLTIEEPSRRNFWNWGAVFSFGSLGILTKECALLLPAFLTLIECTSFRFRGAVYLKWLYGVGAVLAIAGLCYLFGPLDYWGDYFRAESLTAGQRALTEMRVLVFYFGQILLPDPTRMALLHEDWSLSRNLWTPWTTAAAIGFWSSAVVLSLAVYKRYPIVLFGIGWFLVGHLLESTIIPLELIFEHRNYLPSVGILCLVGFGVSLVTVKKPAVGRLLVGGLVIVLSAMTAYRAWQWSDPLTLALTEARHNPTSARARYEYARGQFQLYLIDRKPELLVTTRQELRATITYGKEDFLPLVGLLNTYVAAREPVPEAVMRALERELHEEPPTERRLNAVYLVMSCQMTGSCPPNPTVVLRAVTAALSNPRMDPDSKAKFLEWLAVYYSNVLGDLAAARSVMNDAVMTLPENWNYRARLLEIMVVQQDWPAAREQLTRLEAAITPWMRVDEPTRAKRFDELRVKLAQQNPVARE